MISVSSFPQHQTKKSVNPTVSRSSRYWRNLIYTENNSAHAIARASIQILITHYSLANANFRRETICLNAFIITIYLSFILFLQFNLCFVYAAKIAHLSKLRNKIFEFVLPWYHRFSAGVETTCLMSRHPYGVPLCCTVP